MKRFGSLRERASFVCEERGREKLHRRARANEIPDLTGLSSPYEAPESPEVEVRTATLTIDASVAVVIDAIEKRLSCTEQVYCCTSESVRQIVSRLASPLSDP
jgi:Adenylylsulphate kinase